MSESEILERISQFCDGKPLSLDLLVTCVVKAIRMEREACRELAEETSLFAAYGIGARSRA